jgi:hypothetical protein
MPARSVSAAIVTARHDPAAATNASSGLQRPGSLPWNSGGVAMPISGLPATYAVVRRPPSQSTSTGKRNSL